MLLQSLFCLMYMRVYVYYGGILLIIRYISIVYVYITFLFVEQIPYVTYYKLILKKTKPLFTKSRR